MSESIYEHFQSGIRPPEKETGSLWFVFNSGRLLVDTSDSKTCIPLSEKLHEKLKNQERKLYLGMLDGYSCYCLHSDESVVEVDKLSFRELRSLYGVLRESEFLLAGRAEQILHWDLTTRFCGRCGHATIDKTDERAKICPQCGTINYPRLSPAVITAIIRDKKILLAHSVRFKNNMYGLIAGFVEPGETLEECVQREIMEEVGIRVKNIRYFTSQPWPYPDSLMVGFVADYADGEIKVDGVEISDAGWFGNGNYPALPSKPSIARKLIDWFIENVKSTY